VELVTAGCANLARHIENTRKYGVPVVVAINAFASDSKGEHRNVFEDVVTLQAATGSCAYSPCCCFHEASMLRHPLSIIKCQWIRQQLAPIIQHAQVWCACGGCHNACDSKGTCKLLWKKALLLMQQFSLNLLASRRTPRPGRKSHHCPACCLTCVALPACLLYTCLPAHPYLSAEELEAVRAAAMAAGASAAVVTRHHALGGAGAVDLAQAVVAACSGGGSFKYLYDAELPIKVRCSVYIVYEWPGFAATLCYR
jgi:hypothetical protein